MATSPKEGKLIYHLTSFDNLESILRNGLISRSDLANFDDVAEKEIINHRELMGLNGFVPFHFFGGNPFDGAVQKTHSDKTFIFLTLHRSFAQKKKFKILIQHPLSLIDCEPLSYSEGFDAIDWEIMELRDYSNHKCREICMAECLSPATISPRDFFCIYTPNQDINNKVIKLRNAILGENAFYVNVNSTLFL